MFSDLRVCVIGDMCLDMEFIGDYQGFSRERPDLPIFKARETILKPGGGANLARCFASLGAETYVVGVYNKDSFYSNCLMSLMDNIDTVYMVEDESVDTPVFGKMYLDNGEHIYRFDIVSPLITEKVREKLVSTVSSLHFPVFVFADYEETRKEGVCSKEVIENIQGRKFATSRKHIDMFSGIDTIVLNKDELFESTGLCNLNAAATCLKDMLNVNEVVVTLGGDGAVSFGDNRVFIKSRKLESVDTCGCGDAFYAAFVLTKLKGWSTENCLTFANAAARVVAKKRYGAAAVSLEEALFELKETYGV